MNESAVREQAQTAEACAGVLREFYESGVAQYPALLAAAKNLDEVAPLAEDWLRLRAIEEAARVVAVEFDDAIKAVVNADWTQEDYDRYHAAREQLESALGLGETG
jgi:hypothetical protein